MTIVEFLILLLIAGVCGTIGQSISGYSFGGWFMSTGVGLIGAVIGRWLASEFGFSYLFPLTIDGEIYPIAWAFIGSALFAAVFGVLTRKN